MFARYARSREVTAITRWGKLDTVKEGLAAAKRAGLAVKINAVALRASMRRNSDDLIAWTGDEGFDLVLIEVMPRAISAARRGLDQYLPLSLVRARLQKKWTSRDRLPDRRSGALLHGSRDGTPARPHHAR